MADIQSFLDAIQNAVYGEEVRGSIVSSLKKVNDDNNSYIDIKTSVLASEKNIQQSVTTFDSLIEQAETKKGELTQEIASAQISITNLKAVIKESETAKSTVGNLITDVQAQISNCEIASNALTASINNATTAKTNLDNSITTGNGTKSSIDGVIKNANVAKDNLQKSITASDTAKGNLETIITTADTKQQALLNTIDTADKSKQALQTKIDEAQETLKKFPEGMEVAWANSNDGTDGFTRTYPDEGLMKYIGLSVKDSTNPIDYVWLMSDQYVDSLKLDKSGGNITGKLTVKEKAVLVAGDLDTDLSDKLSKKDGGTIKGDVDFTGSFKLNDEVPQIPTISKSGIWTIEKYPNGFCKMTAYYTETIAASYASGGGFYYFRGDNLTFPLTFKATPTLNVNGSYGDASSWVSAFSVTNTYCNIAVASIANQTNKPIRLNVAICGYID